MTLPPAFIFPNVSSFRHALKFPTCKVRPLFLIHPPSLSSLYLPPPLPPSPLLLRTSPYTPHHRSYRLPLLSRLPPLCIIHGQREKTPGRRHDGEDKYLRRGADEQTGGMGGGGRSVWCGRERGGVSPTARLDSTYSRNLGRPSGRHSVYTHTYTHKQAYTHKLNYSKQKCTSHTRTHNTHKHVF